MELGQGLYRRFTDALKTSQTVGPVLLAVSIGLGAGYAAVGFRYLVLWMRAAFGAFGALLEPGIGAAYAIPMVALGGLLVGLVVHFLSPETRGHGVPEVMLAVTYQGGRIRPRVTVFKALAAALCIGSGGSAGREGPIVQIGSALGSMIAQALRLPDRRITLSVACGAAGGIAATFNAPIAGVIFAMEVILGQFSSTSFGLVVLSSVTATSVSRYHLGQFPAFYVGAEYEMVSLWEPLFYAGLGVTGALVARAYTRGLFLVEDLAERTPVPGYVKPALGGAVVGGLAIWFPQVMGTGYEFIENALNSRMTLSLLAALFALKIVSTAFTIGSGGSGGTFTPALFVGAMYGGAFGRVVNQWFPDITANCGAYALVGMAVVFAGAAHAPITGIIILMEMTNDYSIILPLMSATVLSNLVSRWLSEESMYTIKVKRRRVDLRGLHAVNPIEAVTVEDAMTREFASVPPGMPLTGLIMRLAAEGQTGYPVVDADGVLVGVVTAQDVQQALINRNPDRMTVAEICTRNVVVCRPEQSLSTVLPLFGTHDIGRLPVIDPDHPDRIIGVLRRTDVVSAYAGAHGRISALLQRADELRDAAEATATALTAVTVHAGSVLAGVFLRDAAFPPGTTVAMIRRGDKTLIPDGSTRIEPGDALEVVSARATVRSLRKWLKRNAVLPKP